MVRIDYDHRMHSYSNRAIAYIQLQQFAQAEVDASKAIDLDPLFTKAWLRRGICRIHRKAYKDAMADLRRVWSCI